VTPEVSAVVVSHRSAAEAARCVASLARAFAHAGIEGETVLVDCGSGREETDVLRQISADRHVLLGENRGYSGGVNAGLVHARGARLIVSNADVEFSPSSLGRLLKAIAEPRVGAAAPLSTWDSEGRLRLPPGYAPGLFRDGAQLLSGLFPALDRRRFAAFARETLRLLESGGRARHLSGAVLAARRDVFDAVGRFDERFPFEYEETEWEDRVRSKGFDLLFVPEARVRHFWAVSSSRNPETGARRAASERLYRLRRYGWAATALLYWAARLPRPAPAASRLSEPRAYARPGAGLALSPNPSGFPFACADLSLEFQLPDEVRSSLGLGPWYFTVFGKADGRLLERFVWEKGAA